MFGLFRKRRRVATDYPKKIDTILISFLSLWENRFSTMMRAIKLHYYGVNDISFINCFVTSKICLYYIKVSWFLIESPRLHFSGTDYLTDLEKQTAAAALTSVQKKKWNQTLHNLLFFSSLFTTDKFFFFFILWGTQVSKTLFLLNKKKILYELSGGNRTQRLLICTQTH